MACAQHRSYAAHVHDLSHDTTVSSSETRNWHEKCVPYSFAASLAMLRHSQSPAGQCKRLVPWPRQQKQQSPRPRTSIQPAHPTLRQLTHVNLFIDSQSTSRGAAAVGRHDGNGNTSARRIALISLLQSTNSAAATRMARRRFRRRWRHDERGSDGVYVGHLCDKAWDMKVCGVCQRCRRRQRGQNESRAM